MLTNKIEIEFAKGSDLIEISRFSRDEIEYGLGWNYTAKKLSQLLKNKEKNVVVARNKNNLVGFGVMTYRGDQANLDLLGVKKEHRRMKVGTQIVLWLEKVAVTGGIYNIFVQVRENNTAAIAFYESLGFNNLELIERFYKGVENGFVMAKTLRSMINAT